MKVIITAAGNLQLVVEVYSVHAHLFVKAPRLGDSEVTFESSYHLKLLV